MATTPSAELNLHQIEKPVSKVITRTGSSSFEKVVSACTGAIITMSFSKFIDRLFFFFFETANHTVVNPLDVVKTRLQETSNNGTRQYTGTIVRTFRYLVTYLTAKTFF